ncbi:uncharacterized protein LACBIDRAFT_329353 [Laccaria bicolor S238N-H82]|uniref:Predicted protein n=1 Tax=Laccaria bicolor (strain S238N-H82 / ATCC MYA-4686) TaxID=486041 RepID=B0DHS4_LACBS|nr:uncharacterized protein LACBIDRAFT_329353 [Laccaria bicolor S238N-H82]EDR05780.1 predicted protein [Laccaria bicolor S238N-H82]|eukprot:XP_001883456.1 predicted protein [Laccaria bicolor S238N-H82]
MSIKKLSPTISISLKTSYPILVVDETHGATMHWNFALRRPRISADRHDDSDVQCFSMIQQKSSLVTPTSHSSELVPSRLTGVLINPHDLVDLKHDRNLPSPVEPDLPRQSNLRQKDKFELPLVIILAFCCNMRNRVWSLFQNLRNRVWRREKSAEPQEALFPDTHDGDIIIPVMGLTGVGKSTVGVHYDKAEVSDGYESCTTILKAFYTPLEPSEDFGLGRRLVLVDTPGFDSTCGHDFRLLQRIALCLTSSYGGGKTCGGLIHLHDMTDAGVRSITSQNLQAYKKLCGKKNLRAVVFATATPGSLTPQAFARREQEHYSEVYRKDFKEQGATFFRLTHTHESAKDLVSRVLERVKEEQRALLIQEELVEIRKIVPTATKAGRELKNGLDEIIAYQKEVRLAGEVISQEEVAALASKIAIVSPPSKGHDNELPLAESWKKMVFLWTT